MTKKYEIIRLEKMANDEVLIELSEVPLHVSGCGAPNYLQVVDSQEQLPETESIPLPENEEEEIIAKQAAAIKKFMPELFPKPCDSICSSLSPPTVICSLHKQNTILYLTFNEFVSLDLTIGSIVCLDISVYKGDE